MAEIKENPITSLISKKTGDTYRLGAIFKDIFYDENNLYSLKDFFNYMSNFLEQDLFTYYGSNEPVSTHINIWYDSRTEEIPD